MANLTNAAETDLLELLFNNTAWTNIGDAGGLLPSATAGSLYIALFSTDPTDTGGGTEATYTSYARQGVVRSGSGWTVSGDTVSNAALITFPEATGGSETLTHFGIMTAVSGGSMLLHGALGASLAVSTGTIPEFAIGALTATAA